MFLKVVCNISFSTTNDSTYVLFSSKYTIEKCEHSWSMYLLLPHVGILQISETMSSKDLVSSGFLGNGTLTCLGNCLVCCSHLHERDFFSLKIFVGFSKYYFPIKCPNMWCNVQKKHYSLKIVGNLSFYCV